MADLPAIVETLRDRRRAMGMCQEHVAFALDVSSRCFGAWERGEKTPGADRFLSWAGFLGLEVSLQENVNSEL
jgi:transcriptional regulator with XRE-family HTH domain